MLFHVRKCSSRFGNLSKNFTMLDEKRKNCIITADGKRHLMKI